MNIQIDKNLFDTYSDIRLGCIKLSVDVQEPNEQFWNDMENEILPAIQKNLTNVEWSKYPGVKGSRKAYKAFGRNPGRYRVSSESLLRRVKRGDALYKINSVVDVNNLLSVKSGLSVGSYDLSKIKGEIQFRKAVNGEGYTGIGKDFLDMENMLVLADDEGIFGSSMSDSTRAMVTMDTKEVLVVFYCFEKEIDLKDYIDLGLESFKKYTNWKVLSFWIEA